MPSLLPTAKLLNDTSVRVTCQCGVGVLGLLAIFSTPVVWDAMSLNRTFVTPQVWCVEQKPKQRQRAGLNCGHATLRTCAGTGAGASACVQGWRRMWVQHWCLRCAALPPATSHAHV